MNMNFCVIYISKSTVKVLCIILCLEFCFSVVDKVEFRGYGLLPRSTSILGLLGWFLCVLIVGTWFGCDSGNSSGIDGGDFMSLFFGSSFFQAIIMGWCWLLLVFSFCFGQISASTLLSLICGYDFS